MNTKATPMRKLPGLEGTGNYQNEGYVDFHIDGMEALNADNTFRLHGMEPLAIDWSKVGELLQEAGVEKHDAYMLADEFAETVNIRMMSKALAKRMQRI